LSSACKGAGDYQPWPQRGEGEDWWLFHESEEAGNESAPSQGEAEYFDCLAYFYFCPNSEKLVHLSQLATMVAIGLQKPYAKSESGMNLVM
jgi:hypothetical protein